MHKLFISKFQFKEDLKTLSYLAVRVYNCTHQACRQGCQVWLFRGQNQSKFGNFLNRLASKCLRIYYVSGLFEVYRST